MSLPTQSELGGLDYAPTAQGVAPRLGFAPDVSVDTLGLDYFSSAFGVVYAVAGSGSGGPTARPVIMVCT